MLGSNMELGPRQVSLPGHGVQNVGYRQNHIRCCRGSGARSAEPGMLASVVLDSWPYVASRVCSPPK